ncbi:MAG: class I SAM-dependent methyltransferase [Actinomycetota bacterium]|nr:class I SAM-dependent methyltransferase [Actinomycetota bacterium]
MASGLYEEIGRGYAQTRRADPRIAHAIDEALGAAHDVVNIGAGTGSYEPDDRNVLAVEPSADMRVQRPAGSAPCVGAAAEQLPLPDASVDAAMAIYTDFHWRDRGKGIAVPIPHDCQDGFVRAFGNDRRRCSIPAAAARRHCSHGSRRTQRTQDCAAYEPTWKTERGRSAIPSWLTLSRWTSDTG